MQPGYLIVMFSCALLIVITKIPYRLDFALGTFY